MAENADPENGPPRGHAALMDQVYRNQRHIYDLTRKYYLLGRDRLVRELGATPGQSIVEIGCGTARNLIRIAETYPGVMLYGLDASHEMLSTAEEAVRKAGLSQRIKLVHGYAENTSPAMFGLSAPFDHAIFSYSLAMIPDWRAALAAAARSVGTRGRVHVVDFGDLEGLWSPFGRALRAWLRLFHVTPRDRLLKLLETAKGPEQEIYILPGRYAFVFRASPQAVAGLENAVLDA